MKVLNINYEYYKFPQNISDIEEFMLYANEHYHSFIPLIQFKEDNCVFPYLIEEDTKTIYVNLARMGEISAEEVTVIPTRKEYDDKLKHVIREKCIDCEYYEEDDDLSGHRNKLTLDGECVYKKVN
ncbi:MAG: hypothetical protein J1F64_09695 [Oscillospiraceae bacterium]|nr:hypothetical protein [Oscillospiraceae bacterium]